MMIKQGDSETVTEYARRVEEMSNRAYSDRAIGAEFRIPIFIRGIRESRVRLALVTGDDKSFDELVKTANRIEQASIIMESPGDLRVFSSSRGEGGESQGFLQAEEQPRRSDQSFRASDGSKINYLRAILYTITLNNTTLLAHLLQHQITLFDTE